MNVIILLCVSMMIGQSQQDTGLYRMGVTLAEQYGDVSVRIQDVELQQEATLKSALRMQKHMPCLVFFGILSILTLMIGIRYWWYSQMLDLISRANGLYDISAKELKEKSDMTEKFSKRYECVALLFFFCSGWHALRAFGIF